MNASAPSTELTGGTGFTFEDTVAAYYLALLLMEGRGAGQSGRVTSVAVQRAGHREPLDDVIIDFEEDGQNRRLSIQAKREVTISAAASNSDFRAIVAASVATRAKLDFTEFDAYGFAVEHITVDRLRSLQRLIDWAKASPTDREFNERFGPGGVAGADERTMRSVLAPLIGAGDAGADRTFYQQFVALHLPGLTENGAIRTMIINQLQELVATNLDGQDILLFDRLCRIVRDGEGSAYRWSRATLLNQLRGTVRLNIAPRFQRDLDALKQFCETGLAEVADAVEGFHVPRPTFDAKVEAKLASHRLVNISGLPGCGKSAILKRAAQQAANAGPIPFIKADQLEGTNWQMFAGRLGLEHRSAATLLAEIGSAGTAVLFIDGIDRVRPDQKAIITDLLRAIETSDELRHWKVLATSRDQGLEAYRTWFPKTFIGEQGIGDVAVTPFSDEEAAALAAERPALRRLLIGSGPNVQEIARRPFFAAVLASSLPADIEAPQTEVDLINAWWSRGGHDAAQDTIRQRQRAMIDLAENGSRSIGKSVAARDLATATVSQLSDFERDLVIRPLRNGAAFSFTHDIFFEWAFFRLLLDLGDAWPNGLINAGEPPLLGRVVGLVAQSALETAGEWTRGLRALEAVALRPQWRREWITAPPFSQSFTARLPEFQTELFANDCAVMEKLLVWFQAQHTIPSPVILQQSATEGVDRMRVADLLGWPSDFPSWGRLVDWLVSIADTLPTRLYPLLIEALGVWQNAIADYRNARSRAIVDLANRWLIEIEGFVYREELSFDHGRWEGLRSQSREEFEGTLRRLILRAARAFPDPSRGLLDRAIANQQMREHAYSDIMLYAPILTEVAPEKLIEVTKAEVLDELPQDRIDRIEREEDERIEALRQARATPEAERTEQQRRSLEHISFAMGRSSLELEAIGIQKYGRHYFPTSAREQPFAALFDGRPDLALGLVKDLMNHGTEGWRQRERLSHRRGGTALPIVVEFPWGKQEVWGDWTVYSWFLGHFAPQPLECAVLALAHWAHRELEAGKHADDVIRSVVEGSHCIASLGLALTLALEKNVVSETTLPLASCQRLWQFDIARSTQSPTRDIEIPAFGLFNRLKSDKADAAAFLRNRESEKREVRQLAMLFALSPDEALREKFKARLADYPKNLPFEFEGDHSEAGSEAALREKAERWSGLGDIANYRRHDTDDGQMLIGYEPPVPLSPSQQRSLDASSDYLRTIGILGWATRSLEKGAPDAGLTLADAVRFAQDRDNPSIFKVRTEAGGDSAQSAISAIAACVIKLGALSPADTKWALGILKRVEKMEERPDAFPGTRSPRHPTNHLVVALLELRKKDVKDEGPVTRLFGLTLHPMEEVHQLAFVALLRDPDQVVQWIAAQHAFDLALSYRFKIEDDGTRDNSEERAAKKASLARALKRLRGKRVDAFDALPGPWVKGGTRRGRKGDDEEYWKEPDPSFFSRDAAGLLSEFPVEAWCQSPQLKELFRLALKQWVAWTAEKVMPPWSDHRQDRRVAETMEWAHALGDLVARAAPFFELEFVREVLLRPFLSKDEEGLLFLAPFGTAIVCRHVLDAPVVPAGTFELLDACVERVFIDRAFNPNSHRAGEVHGSEMPRLIRALLFVNVERADGAARFVNGKWDELPLILPTVAKVVSRIGWSSFVADCYLTLCERAGVAFPIDAFAEQAGTILTQVNPVRNSWSGTLIPARLAAIVQRLAAANFPLTQDAAQQLLRILDELIDLGDRRSAALEQDETFKNVQRTSRRPEERQAS
jgi:hypothetical protein